MFSPFSIIGHKKTYYWKKKIFFKNYFSTISFDSIFRIWNQNIIQTNFKRFIGHTRTVLDLCESKTLHILISISNDKTLKFWDFLSNRLLRSRKFKFDIPVLLNMNHLSQTMVCAGNKTITIWNINKGSCIHTIFLSSRSKFTLDSILKIKTLRMRRKFVKMNIYETNTPKIIKQIDFFKKYSIVYFNSFCFFISFYENYFFFLKPENSKIFRIFQFNATIFRKNFRCFFLKKFISSRFTALNFIIMLTIHKNFSSIWDPVTGLILIRKLGKFYF